MSALDAEMSKFERFLTSYMPWGARIMQVDAQFQPLEVPGTIEMLVSSATVLDVGLAQEGAYYRVRFGPLDGEGASRDGADDGWTICVVDPVVDLTNGRYAIQMLDPDGHSYNPEQWVLINPDIGTDDLEEIVRGR